MQHLVQALVCTDVWVTGGWPRCRQDVCWKCPEYCRLAIKCNYILTNFLLVYNLLNFCWSNGLWTTVTTEQTLVVREKFVLTLAHSVSEFSSISDTSDLNVQQCVCSRGLSPKKLDTHFRACSKAVLFSEVKQNSANARVGLHRPRLWVLQAMLLHRPHPGLHSKILHAHKSAFWNFKRCKCILFPLFEIPVCSSDC